MTKKITNIAASVGQRLRNMARKNDEDFGVVLTKFALERLLFRISQSLHRDVFVLKGALLFELWTKERYRQTRDADFLARGENTLERFIGIFQDVCHVVAADDGLRFNADSVAAERITEDVDYQGMRVTFFGYLENARIPIQIDIGFGDVITPAPQEAVFPTLLDLPVPKLLVYPRETVVAEKFEAMISRGITNSRMKDFYDVWKLSRNFGFEGDVLSTAVRRTFAARATQLPGNESAVVFTAEFYEDEVKKKQWRAFCEKNRRYVDVVPLKEVCLAIAGFLMPIAIAIRRNGVLQGRWPPLGPWDRG